ncbi:alanyl-tRNA editing protein [Planococcus maitriensis]|uniref:Alanyl-tRNA editing protein n=1 Tax=Planococcus maitriensis TaxID=221799 RepID=A0A365K9T4_9BACL|nr:DHHA1 domain-containing protein [Planococcus maitriensis]RAZ69417.1 alanyl-tRNA editing protein [Planococcus maitriensis]
MTRKLYYEDPFLKQGNVQVTKSAADERGQYVILDRTYFYPEGGGQPADHGVIGTASVLDVQNHGGELRHYLDRQLEPGEYMASLDWNRRWDHMQQHAGQHLLSALLEDRHGYRTTSFHLGQERVSIDLHKASIDLETLRQVELEANRIISRHLPIRTRFVNEDQLVQLNLRKPPAVSGDIRLVEMDGIDLNACGGTHPDNTAGIGLLKILGTEKAKGGTRLYFLCGERALEHFGKLSDTGDVLIGKLNAPLAELVQAADVLLTEKVAADKEILELKKQLLLAEAKALTPENGVMIRNFGDRPIKELQQLARLATEEHPAACVLFAAQAESRIRLVCARGDESSADMRETLKRLLAETDGKGGGTPALAQGGGHTEAPFERFQEIFNDIHAAG